MNEYISCDAAPSRVAMVRCEDYDAARVHAAVGRGLTLLGGVERFAKAGERLVLKPNLLSGKSSEKAVTTHPSVFAAVTRHLQAAGATLAYGDSPGFGSPESVARRAGLSPIADTLGVTLADFKTGRLVSFPEGGLIRQFTIAAGALDCDGLVSLPKLKTHAFVRMTGAIKNQFGCIPGLLKGEFHARLPEVDRFAQMLVDLTRFLHPRLYVMDAVVAMEGNGPGSGQPRQMSALLFSEDPVALDAISCRMMGLDVTQAPTIRWGEAMGLGTVTRIELVGDPLESFAVSDFKNVRERTARVDRMNRLLMRFTKNLVVPRPVIDATRCTRCGTCVQVCPAQPKAIDFIEGREHPPVYDYTLCIRCYCCQELCPEEAISVNTPLLGKLLHR